MGANGFIVDPTQSIAAEIRCHVCGGWIPWYWITIDDHASCIDSDGRIPIDVNWENYEERGE